MIKVATTEDLDTVLKLGKEFVREAGYEALSNEAKCSAIAYNFLTSDRKEKIVLLFEDKGMIAGFVSPTLFGLDLIATELMWWVEPSERSKEVGKALLDAFEYWSKSVGAKFVNMTCLDDRVGKFYEKNGYKLFQRTYLKELN